MQRMSSYLITLLQRPMTAGRTTAQWNWRDASGSTVSSGIYFYRLRVGSSILMTQGRGVTLVTTVSVESHAGSQKSDKEDGFVKIAGLVFEWRMTMDPAMQTVLNTLKLGDSFFLNGIATLDDDTARRTIVDHTNPVIWLAGHLLNSRKYLLDLFGDVRELTWESKFSEKYDPESEYPSMAEMKDAWVSISDALFSQMEQASDDHFTKKVDWNLPNGDKTVRGAFLFYAYHEGWHMGQIAYARKGMGMEGLVPY